VLNKSTKQFLAMVVLLAGSMPVFATNFSDAVVNKDPCPVNPANPSGIAYPGTDPTVTLDGIPAAQVIDAEFGPGAQAITQCLKNRKRVKLVVRVDNTFMTDAFGGARFDSPLFLTNIEKMITQFETTHDMKIGKDVEIRVVFSGTGAVLASTSHKIFTGAATRWNAEIAAGKHGGNLLPVVPVNPYVAAVERGMAVGMKFYLCQEASRSLGINMDNKIPGVNFVPAAHAAIADLQIDGYAIILP
jgi:intracellular sulfur oxidation DsrE/DsrF family protein